MSHLPVLSIDVFEAIIDQASDHVASLRQLSLTCTLIQPRARYHLFSSICIRSVDQVHAAPAFLDTHPWIPPLVKKVSLSPGPLSGDRWYRVKNVPLLDIAPVHILSRLPHLHAWRLELTENSLAVIGPWLSFHRSALSCYQRYGCRIRSLELSRLIFDDVSDLTGLVLAFTGIQSVSCSYIKFRIDAKDKPFAYRAGPSMLARSLNLRSLIIHDFVDMRAFRYLLASSGATLSNLVLTLDRHAVLCYAGYNSELEAEAMDGIWLRQLSSFTLIIPCYENLDHDPDENLSWFIKRARNFLEHVERACLTDVRVEFKLDSCSIALLGTCLARKNATFKACRALDDFLPDVPIGRISCDSPVHLRRAGRAPFWAPAFELAFPNLTAGGLSLEALGTDRDTPYPIGHEGRVSFIVSSFDSKWIATASVDGTIIVWDGHTGTIVQEWLAHHGHSIRALAFSPDSPQLVSAGGKGGLAVWEISLHGVRRKTITLDEDMHAVNACAWSPDGAWIASASSNGSIRLWNATTFQKCCIIDGADTIPVPGGASPARLQFPPDSRYLAWGTLCGPGGIYGHHVCRLLANEKPKWLPSSRRIYEGVLNTIDAFSFDSDSRRIVTACGSHASLNAPFARIWDLATGTMLAVLKGHCSVTVTDVSFSSDGKFILSASLHDSVPLRIWDVESGVATAMFHKSMTSTSGAVRACYSPDGKYVATASSSTVHLWRTDDTSCTTEFIEHSDAEVSQVVFSPNGEFLVSGDVHGIIVIRHFPESLRY